MLRYKEIKKMLETEIAKMEIHERLPSRPELCKKLDTNRSTLDKAIKELAAEGWLCSKNGSGTYVANPNEDLSIHKGNWGVIVRDVRKMFYAEMVRGVENFAQSKGINIILCNSDSDFTKQEQYIKRLIHSGVSGLIIGPSVVSPDSRENYRFYSQLTELKMPFVFCGRNVEGINAPMVASNDFYGGYIATKHLLEKGYRHIAYISQQRFRTSVDRCQGYLTALMENGIEINRKIIIMEDKSHLPPSGFGYEAIKNILSSDQLVDAVLCINDKVAHGVYRAIAEVGRTVSDDIGVIGYDNTGLCENSIPTITSVTFKNLEIGTKAAEVLFKLINKEALSDCEYYLFQPDIVVRDSCLGLKKSEVEMKVEGVVC
jgi:DNA-binding LacI/PurR family transcriptional regulator